MASLLSLAWHTACSTSSGWIHGRKGLSDDSVRSSSGKKGLPFFMNLPIPLFRMPWMRGGNHSIESQH